MSMTNLKKRIRALFGTFEDSSGTVEGEVGQLLRKHIIYEWPNSVKAAAVANPATRMEAQTASLSNSQPIAPRVVYIADKPCEVKELSFAQIVSSTITATYTMSWTLLVTKRGGGDGTFSTTYSVTAFVGGLASVTAAAGSHSFTGSYSYLHQNVAYAPNILCLSKTNSKLSMARGDVLLAQVRKGSGTATDSGAIFRGGTLKITVEEE